MDDTALEALLVKHGNTAPPYVTEGQNRKNVFAMSCRVVKRANADDQRPFTIAFDLDGTLAEKEEPFDVNTIGEPIADAVDYARKFHAAGARIIIFTVRGNKRMVRRWLDQHDIPFDYINENPDQPAGGSGKVIADVYIDDRAIDGTDPSVYGPEVLRRIDNDKEEEPRDATNNVLVVRQRTMIIAPAELLQLLNTGDDHETDT